MVTSSKTRGLGSAAPKNNMVIKQIVIQVKLSCLRKIQQNQSKILSGYACKINSKINLEGNWHVLISSWTTRQRIPVSMRYMLALGNGKSQ